MIVDEEPRAAVFGQLRTPLGAMTVAATHLSFVPGWNRRQLHHLARNLRGLPGPHLIAGDLNSISTPAVRWSGMRSLTSTSTFPTHQPTRQLDHILTDDQRLIVQGYSTPVVNLSDHRPLVVTVSKH